MIVLEHAWKVISLLLYSIGVQRIDTFSHVLAVWMPVWVENVAI
jgi:hypothetical protein